MPTDREDTDLPGRRTRQRRALRQAPRRSLRPTGRRRASTQIGPTDQSQGTPANPTPARTFESDPTRALTPPILVARSGAAKRGRSQMWRRRIGHEAQTSSGPRSRRTVSTSSSFVGDLLPTTTGGHHRRVSHAASPVVACVPGSRSVSYPSMRRLASAVAPLPSWELVAGALPEPTRALVRIRRVSSARKRAASSHEGLPPDERRRRDPTRRIP